MSNSQFDSAKIAARKELADAIVQYGFLRANWGKVSTIVVAGLIVGFAIGVIVGRVSASAEPLPPQIHHAE